MKSLKRVDQGHSFGYNSSTGEAHYSVVGDPADFYIYVKEPDKGFKPWSGQIHDLNVYHELKKCLNDKSTFIDKCKVLFEQNKKRW